MCEVLVWCLCGGGCEGWIACGSGCVVSLTCFTLHNVHYRRCVWAVGRGCVGVGFAWLCMCCSVGVVAQVGWVGVRVRFGAGSDRLGLRLW